MKEETAIEIDIISTWVDKTDSNRVSNQEEMVKPLKEPSPFGRIFRGKGSKLRRTYIR